jgi:hypothetical protein
MIPDPVILDPVILEWAIMAIGVWRLACGGLRVAIGV